MASISQKSPSLINISLVSNSRSCSIYLNMTNLESPRIGHCNVQRLFCISFIFNAVIHSLHRYFLKNAHLKSSLFVLHIFYVNVINTNKIPFYTI